MTRNSRTDRTSNSAQHAKGAHSRAVIEYRPIESLRAFEKNPRRHPEQQVARLSASLAEFGFCLPILVDRDGEIIAGHGRVEAAKRLGMTEVPVLIATDWSIPKIRAFRVADNRLAELSVWDSELLAIQLAELVDLAIPVEPLGWDAVEIDLIVDPPSTGDGAHLAKCDDGLPEAAPVSRIGDEWLLGSHRLRCTSGALQNSAGPNSGDLAFFLSCVDGALRRWGSNEARVTLAETGETFAQVAIRRGRETPTDATSSRRRSRN